MGRVKPSTANGVFIILAAGMLAACSGGGDEGARDGGPDSGGADPVLEILARPHVHEALAAAAAAGYPITVETAPNPPPITGYYLKPLDAGHFVASGNGANLTSRIAGSELRVTVESDGSVTEAGVSFSDVAQIGSGVTSGMLLRGASDSFTMYLSGATPCTYDGSDRVTEGVTIRSGHFVAATGDWETVRQISITVSATGTRTASCDQAYAGDTEVPGGWIIAEVPRYQRITVDDLQYMCVDEDAGYIAGETWTEADSTACTCNSYYGVECDY
jgi:hypothetical protein